MKEKLERFISDVGNISTASSILNISNVTLKKYLAGNVIPKVIWDNKISPFIGLSKLDILKVLLNRINILKDKNKSHKTYIEELYSKIYELALAKNKLSKKFELVLDEGVISPLIFFLKNSRYEDDPITKLEKVIDNLIADEEYPKIYLYHAMEEYADFYGLFRPYKINRDDYYWNTVSTMDKIYACVYNYLGIDPVRVFSSIQINNFKLDPRLKIEFETSDWKVVKQDLEKINIAIRKTRNKESVRLFAILGKEIPYGLRHYITEYIKSVVDNISDDEIKIGEQEDATIILRGEKIQVKSEPELFYALMEINRKTK